MKQAKCVTRLKKLIKENHPEINLVEMNIPLGNGQITPKLKDILETDVDEKYYLKSEIVEKIVKEANFQERLVSMKRPKSQKEELITVKVENPEALVSISSLERLMKK